MLPQLLLLRQTTVPTVITSFYIVFLGAYRALYVVNWFLHEFDTNMRKPSPISIIFGIIQTAFYVDFAWVYWSRQRVKLRNGGVVDADDLRRGWLLSRIFGHKHFAREMNNDDDDDEESAPALGRRNDYNHHASTNGGSRSGGAPRAKWGSRGISISADEGVLEHERERGQALDDDDDDGDEEHGVTTGPMDPDAKMRDPDELARALDEDEDADAPPPKYSDSSASTSKVGQPSGVRSGDEWDED